jgi:hypothetical protein
MKQVLFIDPGDVHVGIAIYEEVDRRTWSASKVTEVTPAESEDLVASMVTSPDLKVIGWERFRLYGHLASQQIGSEFWTSQLIGAYKYIVRTEGHAKLKSVVQDASIQGTTEKVAKYREVPLMSVLNRQGPHAKSAELHALYYLLTNEYTILDWRQN